MAAFRSLPWPASRARSEPRSCAVSKCGPSFPGRRRWLGPGDLVHGEERSPLAVQGACQLRSQPSPLPQDIVPVLAGPPSLVEVGFLGSVPLQ